MKATITKMEWVKDQNGNQVYEGLEAYRQKMIKQMERQNKKISKAHAEGQVTFIFCL